VLVLPDGHENVAPCYHSRFHYPPNHPSTMIETNPIRARISDLQGRIASLRGYL
jgi:hypothetical protein